MNGLCYKIHLRDIYIILRLIEQVFTKHFGFQN